MTQLDINTLAAQGTYVAPQAPDVDVQYLARRMVDAAAILHSRKTEALRLVQPLPAAERFHSSKAAVRLVFGSNQSAKTFHTCLELSRAVTGQDPYNKYPKTNGRVIVVGYDGDHLADPYYHKLFNEGEFNLIQDEHTRQWRAVRWDANEPTKLDPYDEAYREKWKPGPPLIPQRFVKAQAWENLAKQIPRVTDLTTGWRILWRSSMGRPPRGIQVNIVLLDEELVNAHAWVNEMIPRLLKRSGCMIWAATAQEGGQELHDLTQKAEAGSQYIDAFMLHIKDNPFIGEEQRRLMLETLTDEDEIRVRYHGESAILGRMIYREYMPNGMHGRDPFPISDSYFCRYASVDPGRRHCGTLILGVDPKERHRWILDGFDLQHADATKWASEMRVRQGTMRFEAFVMDQQMGRQRPPGWGKTVAEKYWEAVVEAGIVPRRLGPMHGFIPGSNDVGGREESLRKWLKPRDPPSPFTGTPVLQVIRGSVPELDKQIRLAQYVVDPRTQKEKRLALREDLLVNLEYLAAAETPYYPPEPLRMTEDSEEISVPRRLEEKRRRAAHRNRQRAISFGSGLEIG